MLTEGYSGSSSLVNYSQWVEGERKIVTASLCLVLLVLTYVYRMMLLFSLPLWGNYIKGSYQQRVKVQTA